jgi:transcriptional regulator with XRE-family HTH domain
VTHRDVLPATLGAYLREARIAAKMGQDALAAKIGVEGRHTVIRWEKDKHVPSPGHRQKLIKTLKLEADVYDELAKGAQEEARLEPRLARLEGAVERLERHLFGEASAQGQ